MKQRADAAQALIAKLIWLEVDGPLTLNEHYLADYKAKFLSNYKTAREKAQNPVLAAAIEGYSVAPTAISQVLSSLVALGLNDINADDLVKLLPPDRMDPALNIMSDVRAYFQSDLIFLSVTNFLTLFFSCSCVQKDRR